MIRIWSTFAAGPQPPISSSITYVIPGFKVMTGAASVAPSPVWAVASLNSPSANVATPALSQITVLTPN